MIWILASLTGQGVGGDQEITRPCQPLIVFQNVVAKLGAIIRFQTNVPTSGWAHNNSSQPTCVNTCLCVCVKLLMFQTNSPGHQGTAHLTQSGLKWRYMD